MNKETVLRIKAQIERAEAILSKLEDDEITLPLERQAAWKDATNLLSMAFALSSTTKIKDEVQIFHRRMIQEYTEALTQLLHRVTL